MGIQLTRVKQRQFFSFISILCLVFLNSHTILSAANQMDTLVYGITQFDYLCIDDQIIISETSVKYEETTIEEVLVSSIQSDTPMVHNVYVNYNVNSTDESTKKSWYDSWVDLYIYSMSYYIQLSNNFNPDNYVFTPLQNTSLYQRLINNSFPIFVTKVSDNYSLYEESGLSDSYLNISRNFDKLTFSPFAETQFIQHSESHYRSKNTFICLTNMISASTNQSILQYNETAPYWDSRFYQIFNATVDLKKGLVTNLKIAHQQTIKTDAGYFINAFLFKWELFFNEFNVLFIVLPSIVCMVLICISYIFHKKLENVQKQYWHSLTI